MDGRDLVPVDAKRYARDKARVERGFWDKVRRTLGRVPLLGFIDDAAVLAAAIRSVVPAITEQHRDKARAALRPVGGQRDAA
jgi:hypothetical protein